MDLTRPGVKGLRRSGGGGGDGEVVGAHGAHRGPRGGPGGFEEAEGAWKGARDGREGLGDGDGGEEPSCVDQVQLELHAMEERAMRIGCEEPAGEQLAVTGRRGDGRAERRLHANGAQRETPSFHCRGTVSQARKDKDLCRVPVCTTER